ncbi:DUF1214 domain-containing protein [Nocardia sp. N2S4-5]|uniref:DUF1214 domain-containing protein n=1 Tax=Nocardia sp. N2S4-5 TaxID=3351565 RepID=UPI0037D68C85
MGDTASDLDVAAAIKDAARDTETGVVAPLFKFRTNGQRLPGNWNSPPNIARWGFDYLTRTAAAKSNMYVNQPEETRYFFLEYDNQDRRLSGDPDGTLTLYIQHDSLGPEHEANRLPAPRSEFELTIHTYWPKPQVDNGEWTPPPVVPRTPA